MIVVERREEVLDAATMMLVTVFRSYEYDDADGFTVDSSGVWVTKGDKPVAHYDRYSRVEVK